MTNAAEAAEAAEARSQTPRASVFERALFPPRGLGRGRQAVDDDRPGD